MKKLLLSLMLILISQLANAGVVSIEQLNKVNKLNDVFSIKVVGSDFDYPLEGFGLNIDFEDSILELLSVTVDSNIWEFHQTAGERSAGKVAKIGGASFKGVENNILFAILDFKAIGIGISDLIISDANHRTVVWSDLTLSDIPLDFKNAQVQVVPIPAAFWLMFSGVASLLAIGRTKKLKYPL